MQEADGTWAIYGAPVTFASFGDLSSDLVRRPWPWAFDHLYGLPVDATGNQIPDYLAVLDDVLYLVPGGAGAGRVHGPVAGWRLDGRVPPSPDLAFREADGASMLVDLSGSIAVIDLEPGGE